MTNYYEVLDIAENTTVADIKKAYRSLAKKFHPDLNPDENASEKFIAIEVAYSCLSKSDSRKAHDRLLNYKRNNISHPTVERKYQNDVKRRTRHGRRNAEYRTKMSYAQYERDELWRTSSKAIWLQVIFGLITLILVAILLYNIAVAIYGPDSEEWYNYKGSFALGALFLPAIIGISYAYEPFIKYLIVGKIKKS
ncbi:MAG: DnaJ domain-containing protein [Crocinitomicaceae bacterium]|nr:DnaJ domain-containing protein [Crocinitomicaceae bacterium]